ncbi:MAG: hypothetical protein ACYS99_09265 [Planctomycetota bacterium]|jgi:hypothetical protein
MSTSSATAANIGPAGRRARLVMGATVLVLTAAIGVLLILTDAPRWSRLLLAAPFLFGSLGVLQAREKT